jgi:hypothetical protein
VPAACSAFRCARGVFLHDSIYHRCILGLTVVKFHSHPSGYPEFSRYDDESDRAFFSAVDNILDNGDTRASVVMLPDGLFFGRHVRDGILGEPIDLFRIAGDDFEFCHRGDRGLDESEPPEHALRLIQTFGEGTYRTMRQLRIGVVGASGTGNGAVLRYSPRDSRTWRAACR